MASKSERQSAAKVRFEKSSYKTISNDAYLIPASDPDVLAERDRLLAQIDAHPYDALTGARNLYFQNEKGHRARLRCALTVAYAYALRIVDDPKAIEQFYKDPAFTGRYKLKIDRVLLNSLFAVVGGDKRVSSRYHGALKEFFAKRLSAAEVEVHLEKVGVERLYMRALDAKHSPKPLAVVANDDDEPDAEEDGDEKRTRTSGSTSSSERASGGKSNPQDLSSKAARARPDEVRDHDRDTDKEKVDILFSPSRFQRVMELGIGETATIEIRRINDLAGDDWHRFKCVSLER